MKPRARRVTLAVAALGAAVVGVLVVLNWGTVRDHVDAWWIQLTRETGRIEPHLEPTDRSIEVYADQLLLQCLANGSRLPVICISQASGTAIDGNAWMDHIPKVLRQAGSFEKMTGSTARRTLEALGCRILEQRLPRRAYVVILPEKRTVPIIHFEYKYPDQP